MKYTNEKGERYDLTDELVSRAAEIKVELQKAYSGRANWHKVIKTLESEGYDTVGIINGENFRRVVLRYQLKNAPDNKLEKNYTQNGVLSHELGELNMQKRSTQLMTQEFNRARRQLTDKSLMVNAVEEAIAEHDFNFDLPELRYKAHTGKSLVVTLADIHYAAHIDIPRNKYNPEIARERVSNYANKVIDMAISNNIDDLYIANIGDTIEGAHMRNTQGFDTDLDMSHQITGAIEIVIGFLKKVVHTVAKKGMLVHYTGTAGNHDRFSGNKKDNFYGDSFAVVMNYFVQKFAETNSSLDYIEPDTIHRTVLDVEGKNIAIVHGDLESLAKPTTLGALSTYLDKSLDVVLGGHVHHQSVLEVGNNKYQVTSGSFKGSDNYSDQLGKGASQSQAALLVDHDDIINISIPV